MKNSEPELPDQSDSTEAAPRRVPGAFITESGVATAAAPPQSTAQKRQAIQTTSLMIIAFVALSAAFYVAMAVLVPVVAGMVIALALRPAMRRLVRLGIPTMISSAMLVAMVLVLAVLLVQRLVSPAQEWLERAPMTFRLRQLQEKLEPLQQPLEDVDEASRQVSELTSSDDSRNAWNSPQEVVLRPPSLIRSLVNSTTQLATGALLCVVLTYFFLARGDSLLTHISTALPGYTSAAQQTRAIAQVEHAVSTYLLTVTIINAGLGLCVGLACWMIGVPNPSLWGAMAMLLNFLPYLGGLIGAGVVLMVSLFSFDSIAYSFVAPSVYLILTALEGNFVTPSVLGRSMKLNPLVVILSLTYWTWMWGIAGAILAVPLLAILVSVCRQFRQTQALAAVLSD